MPTRNKDQKFLEEHEIRALLEERIKQAGGMRKLARETGVSQAMISTCGKPGKPIFPAVYKMLGYQSRRIYYRE
jgi:DNA-binding phage protein